MELMVVARAVGAGCGVDRIGWAWWRGSGEGGEFAGADGLGGAACEGVWPAMLGGPGVLLYLANQGRVERR